MYAFVLGTGRCGSTLVQEVLARHPATGFISNLEDRVSLPPAVSRWNGAMYRRLPQGATKKGRARFAPSEAYNLLSREVSPMLAHSSRDLTSDDVTPWLADRWRRSFAARAHAQQADVFLHKFTGWPRVGFIRTMMPDARFVHVVRDGRAVANSWLQMPWWSGYQGPGRWEWGPLSAEHDEEWNRSGRSFATLAAIGWKLLIDAFEQAATAVSPNQWMEIRYEDVVAEPREAFAQVRSFLGLEPSPVFDDAVARYEFRPARLDAYRQDLDMGSYAMVQMSLRPQLRRLGYLTTADISERAAARGAITLPASADRNR